MKILREDFITGEKIFFNTETGRYSLTQTAKKEISKKVSGNRHYNWKNGITPKNKKIRTSLEIRLWREAVFARDNWTCQKMGKRGVKLQAHHVENFSDNEKLRFDINNGITLSDKSHQEFHKKFGQTKNDRNQLIIFLEK